MNNKFLKYFCHVIVCQSANQHKCICYYDNIVLHIFFWAERPADPNVTVNVERFSGGGNTIIRVSWMQPQNLDQFDIDQYDISVTSTSGLLNMTTACGECTSTVITVSENPNNVQMNTTFIATIAAVNLCGETGPTGTAPYTLSKLSVLL